MFYWAFSQTYNEFWLNCTCISYLKVYTINPIVEKKKIVLHIHSATVYYATNVSQLENNTADWSYVWT